MSYLHKRLGPALTRGLVELSKGRPTTDEHAALRWLSAWLLDNNPNKPRVRMVEEFPMDDAQDDDDARFLAAAKPDVSEMEASAVRIQAHMRGALARKQVAEKRKQLAAAREGVAQEEKEVDEVSMAPVREWHGRGSAELWLRF